MYYIKIVELQGVARKSEIKKNILCDSLTIAKNQI